MKGIIFTGFLDYVERKHGYAFVDHMLNEVPLSTGGAYSSVGNYPHDELAAMLKYVCEAHGQNPEDFLFEWGCELFKHLAEHFPQLVSGYEDAFSLLERLDATIHRNVIKMYPEAEVPQMSSQIGEDGRSMRLEYTSSRPFMHVAHGLLRGCCDYYGEQVQITMTNHSGNLWNHAEFSIERR